MERPEMGQQVIWGSDIEWRIYPVAHLMMLMDCYAAHSSPDVLRAAMQASLHLHYVPSCMTGVLQPLDAYTFSLFKRRHRDRVARQLHHSLGGVLSNMEVIQATFGAIEDIVLGRSWAHSFSRCGFAGDLHSLGVHVKRQLKLPDDDVSVSTALPTLEELQTIFPQRRQLPIRELFALVKREESMQCSHRPDASEERSCQLYSISSHGDIRKRTGFSTPPLRIW